MQEKNVQDTALKIKFPYKILIHVCYESLFLAQYIMTGA